MDRQLTLDTLRLMHSMNDFVVEYCCTEVWPMRELKARRKEYLEYADPEWYRDWAEEEGSDLPGLDDEGVEEYTLREWHAKAVELDFILKARKAFRFSEDELDFIAGS